MRETHTILQLLRERGKKRLPLERVYRLLYNPDLFLMAYGRIYRNQGAMTKGTTEETADGMAMDKINAIIEARTISMESSQGRPHSQKERLQTAIRCSGLVR